MFPIYYDNLYTGSETHGFTGAELSSYTDTAENVKGTPMVLLSSYPLPRAVLVGFVYYVERVPATDSNQTVCYSLDSNGTC